MHGTRLCTGDATETNPAGDIAAPLDLAKLSFNGIGRFGLTEEPEVEELDSR
jgi:hypothetical protein